MGEPGHQKNTNFDSEISLKVNKIQKEYISFI